MLLLKVPFVPGSFDVRCKGGTRLMTAKSDCNGSSPVFNATLEMAEILFPNEAPRLLFIPAKAYTKSVEGDGSVMDLLERGVGDISLPYMTLTPQRAKATPHLPSLGLGGPFLLYRDPALEIDASLANPFSIISFNILAPLALALGFFLVCKFIKFYFKNKDSSHLNKELITFWGIVACVVIGIFLGSLQTDIILKFNVEPKPTDPFEKLPHGLAAELETGRYRAYATSEVYLETLFAVHSKPDTLTGHLKRFHAAAKKYPPQLLISNSEFDALLKSGKKFVIISDHWSVDIFMGLSCELKKRELVGADLLTAFYRSGLEAQMTVDQGRIEMIRRIANDETSNFLASKRCPQKSKRLLGLSLPQVQGVFWLLLLCSSTAALFFLGEILLRHCRKVLAQTLCSSAFDFNS